MCHTDSKCKACCILKQASKERAIGFHPLLVRRQTPRLEADPHGCGRASQEELLNIYILASPQPHTGEETLVRRSQYHVIYASLGVREPIHHAVVAHDGHQLGRGEPVLDLTLDPTPHARMARFRARRRTIGARRRLTCFTVCLSSRTFQPSDAYSSSSVNKYSVKVHA